MLGAASLCALLGSAGAVADEAESPPRAEIHFADLGGIRDFRPQGDGALLIQGTNGKWFRATFFGPCIGLRQRETLAFVTSPGGTLDRFSAILVGRQRCDFRTFEPTEPPAPRARESVEE
jgi:hypothetical protein